MNEHTTPTDQQLDQLETLAKNVPAGPWTVDDTRAELRGSHGNLLADLWDDRLGTYFAAMHAASQPLVAVRRLRAGEPVALPARWECSHGPADDEPYCAEDGCAHECPTIRVHPDDAEAFAALIEQVHRQQAELASERERFKAGLRRADEHVNAMSEELKRYADGKETPVLWSVYNAMHLRAATAESLIAAVRATHKPRTERHGSGCVQCGIVWPCPTYKALDEVVAPQPATEDTLPAWLYQRFAVIHGCPAWDRATDSDRAYWEHQAAAVRRAVARGGFKTTEPAAVLAAVETGE